MLIDKMKLAKKEGLANGQLIFWKPGCPDTEDVGVVLNNDCASECVIFGPGCKTSQITLWQNGLMMKKATFLS